MSKSEIREPRQTRSIEKKNKIAKAGFRLFCEKGFYHTNTNEIAKEAGVSTGIVYHYFKDKKAIFLAAIDQMGPKFHIQMINNLHLSKDRKELEAFLSDIIDKDIKFHKIFKAAHEEFETLCHSDSDVAEYMSRTNNTSLSAIADALPLLGFNIPNSREKVDIAYHMIDQYCDAVVLNRRDGIDYDDMKKIIIETILHFLNVI